MYLFISCRSKYCTQHGTIPCKTAEHLFPEGLGSSPLHRELSCILNGRHLLGQTKVTDFGNVVIRNKNITGRQVSVDKVVGLQVSHGFADVAVKV